MIEQGAAIAVDGVRKSFEHGRVPALRDVSFRVEPGELVALVGASGSGKSTILNLIGALDVPDEGSIVVAGQDVGALRHPAAFRAETVGFVFQSHNLLPTLTAAENVQMAMMGRRPRRLRESRSRELLAEVGLEDRADTRPVVLSGGERQRVAIARALANGPRVLLADEPTGALDSVTGAQVLDLLRQLREQHGTTILLVTNDDTVAHRAERILRLRDGLVSAEAPTI
ncbi:MAG TPA: ABC transporter ATP-binding protein [Gaiellaceae bacterium]|nr:ABC transporter ATP-binding protein [Gaiellaceae bacterium]